MSTQEAIFRAAVITLTFWCLWRVSRWLRANAQPVPRTEEEKDREWEDEQY